MLAEQGMIEALKKARNDSGSDRSDSPSTFDCLLVALQQRHNKAVEDAMSRRPTEEEMQGFAELKEPEPKRRCVEIQRRPRLSEAQAMPTRDVMDGIAHLVGNLNVKQERGR